MRSWTWKLVLTLLITSSSSALADTAGVFDYRAQTLTNGLNVVTLEDFSCPIVAVQLWYHVGSKDEQPDRQGFAHMFEHMMFRGTSILGPTDHFDLLRRTGGSCNAYTAFDQTVYHEVVPADQLELALWLEAERMAFLKIDQESFDTERKVVEEERRLGLNQPYGAVPEKLLAEVFKVHPYRWSPIGRIPHLRAASVQELREFWNRFYVPNNATLVIVGAVKHEEAQSLAERYFGWLPRYEDPPRVAEREPMQTEGKTITIREDNAPLSAVGIGFRTVPVGHVDLVPLQLLATVLGGGMSGGNSSRLYRELVADKQQAVIAMAVAYSLEQDGIFAAGAALSPLGGDESKVRSALEKQIERLRSEPVSEQELTKAKNQWLSQLVVQNLAADSKATLLGSAAVLEGDVSRVNHRYSDIQRVTAADLLRVAKSYLVPERSIQVTIQRNLLGSLFAKKTGSKDEENAPITAKPETLAPPPGRKGLKRPLGFADKPPLASTKPVVAKPEIITSSLPNGLKLMIIKNNEVPYVSMLLGLRAGAWSEAKHGTASMTMAMLTQGTEKFAEGPLAEELETYAIEMSGSAGMDSANVTVGCLTEHVERAIGLLGEVVLHPTFPEAEFQKQKKQLRASLAIAAAQPKYLADRELRRRIYGGHPYARTSSGEPADVDALKVDDLKTWWSEHSRPEQAVLILAGDVDVPKVTRRVQDVLGSWQSKGDAPMATLPPLADAGPTRIFVVDRPGAIQSEIRVGCLAFARADAAFPRGEVVQGYFGGSFNSRLNDTIRVKKGLTYGARGGFASNRFGGHFFVSTFSKTESTAETVRTVFDEIRRLRDQQPTTEELHNTKAYLSGSLVLERETPQNVAMDLWTAEVHGLPTDHVDQTLASIAKTAEGDCMRLVLDIVDPARVVVVVVGDAAKLKAELEKVAPVEIVKADVASPSNP
ncbi:MAG: pitrilysin family protein [Planctomycetota bacterium]